jgi:hypothetical protein
MTNPVTAAAKFLSGLKAARQLLRHPRVIGETLAALEDPDEVDLDQAFRWQKARAAKSARQQHTWTAGSSVAGQEAVEVKSASACDVELR